MSFMSPLRKINLIYIRALFSISKKSPQLLREKMKITVLVNLRLAFCCIAVTIGIKIKRKKTHKQSFLENVSPFFFTLMCYYRDRESDVT